MARGSVLLDQHPNLAIQSERQLVETPFGRAVLLRLMPSLDQYKNDTVEESPPVVFFQGWGERPRTTTSFGMRLARAGFEAILIDFPNMNRRWVPPSAVQDYRNTIFNYSLDAIPGWKAIFAHSEGGFGAINAAAYRDDIYATMLAASAGISGTFRPSELVKGAIHEGLEVAHGTRTNVLGAIALAKAAGGLVLDVCGNPQLSAAEVWSIGATSAVPELDIALEADAHIGVAVCTKDRIFPAERVRTTLGDRVAKLKRYRELDTNHANFLTRQGTADLLIEETRALIRMKVA